MAPRGIHVYRVLQEALNNVARHSGADAGLGAASTSKPSAWNWTSKITGRDSDPTRESRARHRRDARAGRNCSEAHIEFAAPG